MNAQKKPPLVSDHDAAKTGGTGERKNKRKPRRREGDEAKASSNEVQRPVGEREDVPPPAPTPNNTVEPIKRPDPDPKPIPRRKPGTQRGTGR